MRRYTRLSNGFSRKLENHVAATALNYFAYNFIKIHRTLRMSPAMAAGKDRRMDALVERKQELRRLLSAVPEHSLLQYADHIEGRGLALFARICDLDLEGIVAKDRSGR